MRIIILKGKKEAAEKTSSIILSEIKKNPNINLGLPTGETVIPLYKSLVSKIKREKINVSKVKTFNLDEYFGLNKGDKNSFHYFMDKHLFSKINIKNAYFPAEDNPKNYDRLIKDSGDLYLTILGLGLNGHIAFNEPGSKINSKTRIVNLSKETLRSNSKLFKGRKMPKKAITLGISTILKSKKILLVATGKNKAEIISKVINSGPTSSIPATLLKNHRNFTIILDKEAASRLK